MARIKGDPTATPTATPTPTLGPDASLQDRVKNLPPKPTPGATPSPAATPAAGPGTTDITQLSIDGLNPNNPNNPAFSAGPDASATLSDPSDPLLLISAPPNGKGRPAGSYNDRFVRSFSDPKGRDGVKTTSEAEAMIFADDSFRAKVAQQMIAAGILDPTEVNDLGAIQSAWNKVVGQAAVFYAAGNARTPEEVIRLIKIQGGGAGGSGDTPGDTSSTTTSVQNFRNLNGVQPTDIRKALISLWGRAPTDQEIQSYQAGLEAAAKANPVVTQANTHVDANGNKTTTSSESGGIDPVQVISGMATRDPEYGAYQASTTYMDALRQAIGGFTPG
jgi:hypothetical protein